jgi:hypothetical protein
MKPVIPSAILKQHVAILGKTGSGKTSTAKLMVEQVVAEGARVCILDPIKSDWWGLTSSASGKKAGLPFRILGGPRGHLPLHSSAGKALGELVGKGQLRLSILDMADFEPGGLQKFFTDFAASLFKHVRGVVYLVMEEAHEFAPKEKSGVSGENMAVYWAKRLATASRKKGVRLILPTQRAQALHNALLGSCDTLIAHRMTLPADQEQAEIWLKKNVTKELFQEITSSFSQLPTGNAWICSGEAQLFERVQFPRIKTYDNSATPENDDDLDEVKTAPVDKDELKAIIGDAVKEAEANDPKALRTEVARLTAALAKASTKPATNITQNIPDPKATRAAQQAAYDAGWSDCSVAYVARVATVQAKMQQHLLNELGVLNVKKGTYKPVPTASTSQRDLVTGKRVADPRPATAQKPSNLPAPSGDITGPQQRMLDVIAFWQSTGEAAPSNEQVAALCGYSMKASTFRVVAGAMKTSGFITSHRPRTLTLTVEGLARATSYSPTEAAARLREAMSGPQQKVVDELKRSGWSLDRPTLLERLGYSAGASTHRVVIGGLSTMKVVFKNANGELEVSSWAQELL